MLANTLKTIFNLEFANSKHFILIRDDGFYIDDIKFIDKKAKLQFALFEVLIDHYFSEVRRGSSYISLRYICNCLNEKFDEIDIDLVRQTLYIIRKRVKTLKVNSSIIKSEKWQGYRLSNDVFLARKHM